MYFSLCKFKINIPGIIKLHQKYKMQKSKPRFLLWSRHHCGTTRYNSPCPNYNALKCPKWARVRYTHQYVDVCMVTATRYLIHYPAMQVSWGPDESGYPHSPECHTHNICVEGSIMTTTRQPPPPPQVSRFPLYCGVDSERIFEMYTYQLITSHWYNQTLPNLGAWPFTTWRT